MERSIRPYYADPTANTAIGNVMREERLERRERRERMKRQEHQEHGKHSRKKNKDTEGENAHAPCD